MVDKREAEAGAEGEGEGNKKPRMALHGDAAAAAAAVSRPAVSLDALAKAKKALQLQKELKEKMKNLPQLQKPGGAGAAAAAPNAMMVAAAAAKAAQIAATLGGGGAAATPACPPVVLQPTAPGAMVGVRPAAGRPGFRPAPLRLDAQGREVDEHGKPVARAVEVVSTLKVNQSHTAAAIAAPKPPVAGAPLDLTSGAPSQAELEADPGFDPRMANPGGKRLERRRKSTFDFVQEGSFQKQAENMRLKQRFGDAATKRAAALPRGPIGPGANPNMTPIGVGGDANQVPIGVRRAVTPDAAPTSAPENPPPPDVEWWDRHLLATGSYDADVPGDEAAAVVVKESKLTIYVEHPVPIEPPAELPPPPPQPLKLTKQEMKKMRTQRRTAREKEKQDLIRQGLLEPPKPKIKISNLYRVLGEQAVANPTELERETRKQMHERQSAHDDRNLARKLLPEEAKDKKLRRLFDDNGVDTITSVYRLARLDNKQHKFKVNINAQENHMTGCLLVSDPFVLVIVEGCGKSTKRYMKLMLRRIHWEEEMEDDVADGMDEDEDEKEPKEPNTCDLVWQGVVMKQAFRSFRTETLPDAAAARAHLESHGVGNYWDVAESFNREDAPPVTLD